MAQDKIIVRGAKEHNLKNVNVEIPRNKLVVITGLSGSGKSSLVNEILYNILNQWKVFFVAQGKRIINIFREIVRVQASQ